ncbi:MAG: polysaccharide biosynthesis transport protein [Chthoniobacter sp.]|jgi:capsular exopolysaccharide synthesis family protein|nr:polysaccharide biosynthesis transport protein [Chthoniobacter sp.]
MNDTSEVKLHFLDYWRVIKMRLGLIMLAFFLVIVTAGVTTHFLPEEFLSKVTMEVKEDNSGPVQMNGQSAQRTYNQNFVATQFQILQKTEILYPVIERLDLIKEFSGPGAPRLPLQQVYNRLKRSMQLQELRGTGLIEIGVYHTDRVLASNIANTIASVYMEKRIANIEQDVNKGLAQLDEEVRKQRKVVEEAGGLAARIRAREGINDPDPDSSASAPGIVDTTMMQDSAKVNEQRALVSQLSTQIQRIERLGPGELLEALRALGIDDPTVLQNTPLLHQAMAEEARLLNSGVGTNHPRLKALGAQRVVYEGILSRQLDSIRGGLATKLTIEQSRLGELEKQLAKSQKSQIEQKTNMLEYVDAKNKYIQARKVMENAELTLTAERMKINIQANPGKIWEKAEPAGAPARPKVPAYMAVAAVFGLVVGVGLAFFIEYLDTSVKTLDDAERFLQLPVLAVIPKDVSILIKTPGDTADAEAYRILRANVEFNKPSRDANTFTLISGGPGEGKSTTLNNLAYTCAKGGYNVLVVDADLRRPAQQLFFDVENNLGLTDYLRGKADLEEIVRTTRIDNLSFIPSGQLPSDSVGILNSQRMTDLVRKLKSQYDLVFFDSPPILGVSDGSVLSSEVDMTIMVVQHRRFPRAMLQRVKQAVVNVGGRLIGVVINNVDAKHDEGYGYYNNYTDYYAPRQEPERRPAPRGAVPPAPAAAAKAAHHQNEEY